MDTNVKRFKYTALKKAICIILAFITFLASTGLTVVSIMSYEYCNGKRPESFTDTEAFTYYFGGIVSEAAGNAYIDIANKNKKISLEEQREHVVDNICKQYMTEYKTLSENENEIDYNELDYNYFSDSYNVNVKTPGDSDDFYVSSYDLFSFNGESLPKDEETVKSIINELYSSFIDESNNNFDYYGGFVYQIKSLKCYAVYSGNEWSNLDSFNEKELYNSDIYFIYKDGKAQAKGINNETRDRITDYLSNDYARKTDVYVYFNLPSDTESGFNILEYIDTYDYFIGAKDFYNTAVRCYDNFITYIVFAVLMLIVSFVAGFRYLLVAGKRDENAPAKLAFIDYVPFEIHLGIAAGLGFWATFFIAGAIVGDFLRTSILSVWAIIICAALIWLLVLEFSASVARNIMSDRKIYKNFLTYYILRLLFVIFRGILKGTVKLFKRLHRLIKRVFSILSYSPKKFKRNVILIAILYALCNLIAVIIIILFFTAYMAPLGALLTLADLGVNIYLFIKFLNYIKQLDMIITAASNHEDIMLDIDALPQSLKALAQGMKYTNAQLQTAVAKAVKDERLRTELITNVSHDLKTPLTSIINYVDLLSKCGIEDEKAQEYIKVLNDKGAKLKRLIDDLIEASKVTSGNITVNPARLNLYELCLQSVVDVQEDFEKAGLELIIKENGVAPAVLADGPKSFRVIENLLSNARKYSAKGSRVYVNVYEENGMGVFEIKNVSAQPLDISPDELTQRFVRGDKSRNQEGNGLGLSIAKELCRVQNGDLEISIDGDLFKARVKLPIAK